MVFRGQAVQEQRSGRLVLWRNTRGYRAGSFAVMALFCLLADIAQATRIYSQADQQRVTGLPQVNYSQAGRIQGGQSGATGILMLGGYSDGGGNSVSYYSPPVGGDSGPVHYSQGFAQDFGLGGEMIDMLKSWRETVNAARSTVNAALPAVIRINPVANVVSIDNWTQGIDLGGGGFAPQRRQAVAPYRIDPSENEIAALMNWVMDIKFIAFVLFCIIGYGVLRAMLGRDD